MMRDRASLASVFTPDGALRMPDIPAGARRYGHWEIESLGLGVLGRIARAVEVIGHRVVTTAGDTYRTPRRGGSTAAVRRART
jgi:hypothetical protein